MNQFELLQKRLEREIRARKQAETILEEKALELYNTNEELRHVNESLEQTIAERTKALKKSEKRYRQIIETATDLIYRCTSLGKITYINPVGKYVLGYEVEEFIGEHFSKFVKPGYLEQIVSFFKEFRNTKQQENYFEIPLVSKKGKIVWFGQHIQMIFDEKGEVSEIAAVARNVTERKIVEDKLRFSEEKYRGIIENMELGLMEVDLSQNIVRAYKSFCEMTGYSAEELVGKNAVDLFLPTDFQKVMDDQDKRRKSGEASVYEIQIRKKNGEMIWVLISGAPIFNQEGEVAGSIGIHYDITARKKLEHDIKEAKIAAEEAQEAEKHFLAKMSHEIRTPLNAVIGMSHVLYDTNPTEEQKEYLSILKSSSDILQALISDILDFSKIEAGEILVHEKEFDLVGLVKSLQKTFQLKLENRPVEVEIDIDKRIQNLLIGDDLLLNQVLINLMGNAAKFTKEGLIGVGVRIIEEDQTNKCLMLEFEVYDTGIGIAPQNSQFIFQKFKQANSEVRHDFGGSGLGLAIVRQIIEILNGQIWVESELGKGTSFFFTIEYADSGIKNEERTEHLPLFVNANFSSHKIMVAEDNYMNRKYIGTLFEKWDISYVFAHNGREAVDLAQREKFDLIFMDISMPEMNGYEATIEIRNRVNLNQKTPIIALTASALVSKKDRALEIGMTDYLPKPFKPLALLSLIKQHTIVHGLTQLVPSGDKKVNKTNDAKEKIPFSFNPKLDTEYLSYFYDGDLEYAADMFRIFLSNSCLQFYKLEPLMQTNEWELVRKLVHKLKPTFAMVGLTELMEKMAVIQKLAEGTPNQQDLLLQLKKIESELVSFLPILRNDLKKIDKHFLI